MLNFGMLWYHDYRNTLFVFISQVMNVFIVGTLKTAEKGKEFLNHLYFILKTFPITIFLCHCRTFPMLVYIFVLKYRVISAQIIFIFYI